MKLKDKLKSENLIEEMLNNKWVVKILIIWLLKVSEMYHKN